MQLAAPPMTPRDSFHLPGLDIELAGPGDLSRITGHGRLCLSIPWPRAKGTETGGGASKTVRTRAEPGYESVGYGSRMLESRLRNSG